MLIIPVLGEPLSEPDDQPVGEPPAVLVEDLDPDTRPPGWDPTPCTQVIF